MLETELNKKAQKEEIKFDYESLIEDNNDDK